MESPDETKTTKTETPFSFKEAILNKKMLISLFNGVSSGLPYYYIISFIPAWLRSESIDLKTIGLFALVMIPFNWKFLWAPFLDRYALPFLGLRRGWMVFSQLACMGSIFFMSSLDPKDSMHLVVYGCLSLTFFSATQDIVLDAYRRELLDDRELGLGQAFYSNGWRLAGFIPGGLGLILADSLSWSLVHIIVGSFMLIGVVKTLLIKELFTQSRNHGSLKDSIIEPLSEFFKRNGIGYALLFLSFLVLYKLGDNMATALTTPFLLDMGYSKTLIGTTAKLVIFWSSIVGSVFGGLIIYRMGINKSLWIFGAVQWASIFGFALLSENEPNPLLLAGVLAFEYLGVGLGTSAMLAYMARETNVKFTATQLAAFSSITLLPRTFANATTGFLIEGVTSADKWIYAMVGEQAGLGYTHFFYFCGLCAAPGMLLLFWLAPWSAPVHNKT